MSLARFPFVAVCAAGSSLIAGCGDTGDTAGSRSGSASSTSASTSESASSGSTGSGGSGGAGGVGGIGGAGIGGIVGGGGIGIGGGGGSGGILGAGGLGAGGLGIGGMGTGGLDGVGGGGVGGLIGVGGAGLGGMGAGGVPGAGGMGIGGLGAGGVPGAGGMGVGGLGAGGVPGAGGMGVGGLGAGGAGGAGGLPLCVPQSIQPCYTGPAGTQDVGSCKSGMKTCNPLGTDYGPCVGEITPGVESCLTPVDDDCDGVLNESGDGCVCAPGSAAPCYSGPGGTQGIGACKPGMKTCNALGTAYGACAGEVLPGQETCATSADEDCDGIANEGCAALTCDLYQENFDDGNAGTITAGVYKVDWCDTNIPTAMNTPLCMSGRTLRTNDSAIDPTIWVYKGDASCSQVKITYGYYQFALAGVSLQYQQSNDALETCEKGGVFTSVASHAALQQCTQTSTTIPFGNAKGVYIRFEHGAGNNAIWFDDLTVQLLGCDC